MLILFLIIVNWLDEFSVNKIFFPNIQQIKYKMDCQKRATFYGISIFGTMLKVYVGLTAISGATIKFTVK